MARDGAARGTDGFVARGGEPWLRVEPTAFRSFAGSMIEVTYRSSLWDEPVRPLFRFLCGDHVLSEAIGPAPLEAAAIWTGRVPPEADELHVSPTNRPGRFGFRIEGIRRRSWLKLLAEGRRRAPGPARSALLTRLIGWGPESDNNLAWAIGAHPLENYESWAARRRRPLEPEGIDAPRLPGSTTAAFHILVGAGDPASIERTMASLRAQSWSDWEASVSPSADAVVAAIEGAASWFAVLPAGTVLRPDALALVARRRVDDPGAAMVYGDELLDGRPSLKPGWSPRLATALPYLGAAVFASPRLVSMVDVAALLRGEAWRVPPGIVPRPLRRIVAQRSISAAPAPSASAPAAPTHEITTVRVGRAAIVVLTRDQPALIDRLTSSVRARSAPGSYRLVVVDNGSPDGTAAGSLDALTAASDATVLRRPGPFDFSAFCNEAAAATDEPFLVFLNDDMEVLSDRWLERLLSLAGERDVGAVGARLTYPDGRLQHVGVLAGMGGSAGHFGAPAPGDDPGWAGRNGAVHEVSAVTGACLAVARSKFEAVGGFDATHMPVELSDIDLCLKLNDRGWQSLVDPSVHLMHEESFSRGGATFRRLAKYGDQRAAFLDRWRHVLRDDPVFHPALSLYSWRAALG